MDKSYHGDLIWRKTAEKKWVWFMKERANFKVGKIIMPVRTLVFQLLWQKDYLQTYSCLLSFEIEFPPY
jgi:hypothetical protein